MNDINHRLPILQNIYISEIDTKYICFSYCLNAMFLFPNLVSPLNHHNVLSCWAAFNRGAHDWGSSWFLMAYFATGFMVSLQSLLILFWLVFEFEMFMSPPEDFIGWYWCGWKVDDGRPSSIGECLAEWMEARKGGGCCLPWKDGFRYLLPQLTSLLVKEGAGEEVR